jgi:hypothetical protein
MDAPMKIELVSHCWNYSRLLNFQLGSLLEFPPRTCEVAIHVFFSKEDETTHRVLMFFQNEFRGTAVTVVPRELPRRKLMCREVGRNIAALECRSDWIWFTDCDFCFGSGALDAIQTEAAKSASPLYFPARVGISPTHADGDLLVQSLSSCPAKISLPIDKFAFKKIRFAFGGVQLVPGDIARRTGYLNGSRLSRRQAETWQDTPGDRRFREALGTRGVPLNLPNVFRIRHSRAGRFEADVRN